MYQTISDAVFTFSQINVVSFFEGRRCIGDLGDERVVILLIEERIIRTSVASAPRSLAFSLDIK